MTGWQIAGVGAVACLAVWLVFVGWLAAVGRREDARAVAGFVPDCVVLVRRLLREDSLPRRTKLLLGLLIAYLALPFDLVPDVVPVAGQLDDLLLAALVLRRVIAQAGPETVRRHWPGPEASLAVLLRLSEAGRGSGRPPR